MAEIVVTFADGAQERLPAGTTAGDALRLHAERNGTGRKDVRRAVAAVVETDASRVGDLRRALGAASRLAAVAPDSPDGLEVLRHSCAHLMAQAVQRLFPGTEITIRPVIDNGFSHHFKPPEGFTPDDLQRIEQTMRAIVAENLPVSREELPREEAVQLFAGMGEHYKVEIIRGIARERRSRY